MQSPNYNNQPFLKSEFSLLLPSFPFPKLS